MTEDKLSKNDLFILMESYKNNIQLNTTLLEQQKQLLIMNSSAIEKQKELCDSLDKFIEKVTKCSEQLSENHVKLINLLDEKTTTINAHVTEKANSVTSQMVTCSVKTDEALNTIKSKVNLLYVGIGSIVLAVIGLSVVYADKFLHLQDIVLKVAR